MFRTLTLTFSTFFLASPTLAQEVETPPGAPAEPSAEAAQPEDAAEPSAPPAEQPVAAPAESPQALELRTKKDKALLGYSVGNVDAALANLRLLITQCDDLGKETCDDSLRAELFVALAIVLAGGKNDEAGGARLFHAALTYDPDVTVPRDLATTPVQRAMREANRSTSFEALTSEPQPEPTSAQPRQETASAEVTPPKSEDKEHHGIMFIQLQGGGGETDTDSPGGIGAGLTVGVLPTESSWVIAARGRAMAFTETSYYGSTGVGGVSLLSGSVWGKDRTKDRFGYLMGGLGIDSYAGEPAISAHGIAGVSLRGFLIGGGLETGAGYGNYAMVTLHLGWGGRI